MLFGMQDSNGVATVSMDEGDTDYGVDCRPADEDGQASTVLVHRLLREKTLQAMVKAHQQKAKVLKAFKRYQRP